MCQYAVLHQWYKAADAWLALFARFGRKKTMLVYSLIKIVGLVMAIFGQNYVAFVVGRFLVGFGVSGYHLAAYVLGIQIHKHNCCNSPSTCSSTYGGDSVIFVLITN